MSGEGPLDEPVQGMQGDGSVLPKRVGQAHSVVVAYRQTGVCETDEADVCPEAGNSRGSHVGQS